MNKKLLKKLIKEVIREVEDESSSSKSSPSTREPIVTPPPDEGLPSSNVDQALQQILTKPFKDEVISMRIRGIKQGAPTLGEFIRDFIHKAKIDDLSLVHMQIQRKGSQPITMDVSQLNKVASGKIGNKKESRPIKNLDPKFNFGNLEPEEQQEWVGKNADPKTIEYLKTAPPEEVVRMIDGNLPKEKKKELYRLACIRPGEKEEEWKSMTSSDMEKERKKAKLRASKLAAGTLEIDSKTGLPKDSSLWTDKEWDAYTQGGEAKSAVQATGQKAGQSVYRPSFKKTDRADSKRHVFSPIDYKKE